VSIRLAAGGARELQKLAETLGMPCTLVIRTLVAIAAADKDLVRLGVVIKVGER
jgi:hypothetical protein